MAVKFVIDSRSSMPFRNADIDAVAGPIRLPLPPVCWLLVEVTVAVWAGSRRRCKDCKESYLKAM